jgi:RimJ/RimL family protein N-acetyltransferase
VDGFDRLTLVGNHVRLSPLSTADVPALVTATNEDPASYRYSTAPGTSVGMTTWVQDALAAREAGVAVPFTIFSFAHGRIVGSTRFYEIERWRSPSDDSPPGTGVDACLVGYTWLAASAQRTACNTEAKLLMLTHAFEEWRGVRVGFRIDARNERSRAAVARLGATFEGVRRAERLGADGAIRDSAYYSILAAEWPEIKTRLRGRVGRSAATT